MTINQKNLSPYQILKQIEINTKFYFGIWNQEIVLSSILKPSTLGQGTLASIPGAGPSHLDG